MELKIEFIYNKVIRYAPHVITPYAPYGAFHTILYTRGFGRCRDLAVREIKTRTYRYVRSSKRLVKARTQGYVLVRSYLCKKLKLPIFYAKNCQSYHILFLCLFHLNASRKLFIATRFSSYMSGISRRFSFRFLQPLFLR